MKHLSIQKEFGWCNTHTLTNVLRDGDFKEFLSNEEFKSGDIDDMNEMLQHAGYSEWNMKALVGVAEHYPPLPKDYLNEILSNKAEDSMVEGEVEIPIIPYFLTVKVIERCWHSVALLRYKDIYLYSDPKNDSMIKLNSINEIHNHFIKCSGIERLEITKSKQYIVLKGENLGYDWLLDL